MVMPPPDPTGFAFTGSMTVSRMAHTATKLPSGDVLVIGGEANGGPMTASVELYSVKTGTFSTMAPMPEPRSNHTATLLGSGQVLVTGGGNANIVGVPSGVDVKGDGLLYDPVANAWTRTSKMTSVRHFHQASILPSGDVLVVGGANDQTTMEAVFGGPQQAPFAHALATAEMYDVKSRQFHTVGSMKQARFLFEATALADGRIMISGGATDVGEQSFATTEIYDPTTSTFVAGPMLDGVDRLYHRVTQLGSGHLLLAGGKRSNIAFLPDAMVLADENGPWKAVARLASGCTAPSLVTLKSGRALITGGETCDNSGCHSLDNAEVFDEITGVWTPTGAIASYRSAHTSTVLDDGHVLLTGGLGNRGEEPTAELSTP